MPISITQTGHTEHSAHLEAVADLIQRLFEVPGILTLFNRDHRKNFNTAEIRDHYIGKYLEPQAEIYHAFNTALKIFERQAFDADRAEQLKMNNSIEDLSKLSKQLDQDLAKLVSHKDLPAKDKEAATQVVAELHTLQAEHVADLEQEKKIRDANLSKANHEAINTLRFLQSQIKLNEITENTSINPSAYLTRNVIRPTPTEHQRTSSEEHEITFEDLAKADPTPHGQLTKYHMPMPADNITKFRGFEVKHSRVETDPATGKPTGKNSVTVRFAKYEIRGRFGAETRMNRYRLTLEDGIAKGTLTRPNLCTLLQDPAFRTTPDQGFTTRIQEFLSRTSTKQSKQAINYEQIDKFVLTLAKDGVNPDCLMWSDNDEQSYLDKRSETFRTIARDAHENFQRTHALKSKRSVEISDVPHEKNIADYKQADETHKTEAAQKLTTVERAIILATHPHDEERERLLEGLKPAEITSIINYTQASEGEPTFIVDAEMQMTLLLHLASKKDGTLDELKLSEQFQNLSEQAKWQVYKNFTLRDPAVIQTLQATQARYQAELDRLNGITVGAGARHLTFVEKNQFAQTTKRLNQVKARLYLHAHATTFQEKCLAPCGAEAIAGMMDAAANNNDKSFINAMANKGLITANVLILAARDTLAYVAEVRADIFQQDFARNNAELQAILLKRLGPTFAIARSTTPYDKQEEKDFIAKLRPNGTDKEMTTQELADCAIAMTYTKRMVSGSAWQRVKFTDQTDLKIHLLIPDDKADPERVIKQRQLLKELINDPILVANKDHMPDANDLSDAINLVKQADANLTTAQERLGSAEKEQTQALEQLESFVVPVPVGGAARENADTVREAFQDWKNAYLKLRAARKEEQLNPPTIDSKLPDLARTLQYNTERLNKAINSNRESGRLAHEAYTAVIAMAQTEDNVDVGEKTTLQASAKLHVLLHKAFHRANPGETLQAAETRRASLLGILVYPDDAKPESQLSTQSLITYFTSDPNHFLVRSKQEIFLSLTKEQQTAVLRGLNPDLVTGQEQKQSRKDTLAEILGTRPPYRLRKIMEDVASDPTTNWEDSKRASLAAALVSDEVLKLLHNPPAAPQVLHVNASNVQTVLDNIKAEAKRLAHFPDPDKLTAAQIREHLRTYIYTGVQYPPAALAQTILLTVPGKNLLGTLITDDVGAVPLNAIGRAEIPAAPLCEHHAALMTIAEHLSDRYYHVTAPMQVIASTVRSDDGISDPATKINVINKASVATAMVADEVYGLLNQTPRPAGWQLTKENLSGKLLPNISTEAIRLAQIQPPAAAELTVDQIITHLRTYIYTNVRHVPLGVAVPPPLDPVALFDAAHAPAVVPAVPHDRISRADLEQIAQQLSRQTERQFLLAHMQSVALDVANLPEPARPATLSVMQRADLAQRASFAVGLVSEEIVGLLKENQIRPIANLRLTAAELSGVLTRVRAEALRLAQMNPALSSREIMTHLRDYIYLGNFYNLAAGAAAPATALPIVNAAGAPHLNLVGVLITRDATGHAPPPADMRAAPTHSEFQATANKVAAKFATFDVWNKILAKPAAERMPIIQLATAQQDVISAEPVLNALHHIQCDSTRAMATPAPELIKQMTLTSRAVWEELADDNADVAKRASLAVVNITAEIENLLTTNPAIPNLRLTADNLPRVLSHVRAEAIRLARMGHFMSSTDIITNLRKYIYENNPHNPPVAGAIPDPLPRIPDGDNRNLQGVLITNADGSDYPDQMPNALAEPPFQALLNKLADQLPLQQARSRVIDLMKQVAVETAALPAGMDKASLSSHAALVAGIVANEIVNLLNANPPIANLHLNHTNLPGVLERVKVEAMRLAQNFPDLSTVELINHLRNYIYTGDGHHPPHPPLAPLPTPLAAVAGANPQGVLITDVAGNPAAVHRAPATSQFDGTIINIAQNLAGQTLWDNIARTPTDAEKLIENKTTTAYIRSEIITDVKKQMLNTDPLHTAIPANISDEVLLAAVKANPHVLSALSDLKDPATGRSKLAAFMNGDWQEENVTTRAITKAKAIFAVTGDNFIQPASMSATLSNTNAALALRTKMIKAVTNRSERQIILEHLTRLGMPVNDISKFSQHNLQDLAEVQFLVTLVKQDTGYLLKAAQDGFTSLTDAGPGHGEIKDRPARGDLVARLRTEVNAGSFTIPEYRSAAMRWMRWSLTPEHYLQHLRNKFLEIHNKLNKANVSVDDITLALNDFNKLSAELHAIPATVFPAGFLSSIDKLTQPIAAARALSTLIAEHLDPSDATKTELKQVQQTISAIENVFRANANQMNESILANLNKLVELSSTLANSSSILANDENKPSTLISARNEALENFAKQLAEHDPADKDYLLECLGFTPAGLELNPPGANSASLFTTRLAIFANLCNLPGSQAREVAKTIFVALARVGVDAALSLPTGSMWQDALFNYIQSKEGYSLADYSAAQGTFFAAFDDEIQIRKFKEQSDELRNIQPALVWKDINDPKVKPILQNLAAMLSDPKLSSIRLIELFKFHLIYQDRSNNTHQHEEKYKIAIFRALPPHAQAKLYHLMPADYQRSIFTKLVQNYNAETTVAKKEQLAREGARFFANDQITLEASQTVISTHARKLIELLQLQNGPQFVQAIFKYMDQALQLELFGKLLAYTQRANSKINPEQLAQLLRALEPARAFTLYQNTGAHAILQTHVAKFGGKFAEIAKGTFEPSLDRQAITVRPNVAG